MTPQRDIRVELLAVRDCIRRCGLDIAEREDTAIWLADVLSVLLLERDNAEAIRAAARPLTRYYRARRDSFAENVPAMRDDYQISIVSPSKTPDCQLTVGDLRRMADALGED